MLLPPSTRLEYDTERSQAISRGKSGAALRILTIHSAVCFVNASIPPCTTNNVYLMTLLSNAQAVLPPLVRLHFNELEEGLDRWLQGAGHGG